MRLAPTLLFLAALWTLPLPAAWADTDQDISAADNESGFGNVDLLDLELTGRIGVMQVSSNRSSEDMLSILASLKNLTGRTLRLEAQTLYKDASGNWIDGGRAGWITLEITPHGQLEYRSESLSRSARDFLVRIRLPGSSTMIGSTAPGQ